VQSTPKTKAAPADHASSVSNMKVIGFCLPAPVVTHSEKSTKAGTTEPHHVGFASDVLSGNPGQCLLSPETGSCGRQFNNGSATTGLSMELRGVALSPSGQITSPCQSMRSPKHTLNFDDSDSCIKSSPKVPRMCDAGNDEQDACELSVGNCVTTGGNKKSPTAAVEADCKAARPRKNVVIHASMPISVSSSQRNHDDVTPVTHRSHKFLVCCVRVDRFVLSLTAHD